jgi:hypothetical protein
VHLLISVFSLGVKLGAGRPRSRQEGPTRAAECPHNRRSGARGRCLLTHGGGGDARPARHRFAPLGGLPSDAVVATGEVAGSVASLALSLRIDGPSSSRR